jgi:hypothetical protein
VTTDYGAWLANSKADAVEQRMDGLTGSLGQAAWARVNTWYNGWGVYSGRYVELKVVDQGRLVRVSGQFSGGGTTDGWNVFWVSSEFWPGRVEPVQIGASGGSGGSISGVPYVEFTTDGYARIYGAGTYTGGHWIINGHYPLDTTY